ncbi:MAG: hypothetical protein IKN96_03555, partial [Oscillibacter sp.]|nr:hypothetical protein [Oscillibacter sp.]
MQKFKRLFSAFLACAIMLGMVAAPIPAEAAATDYEIIFDGFQKLTPGTAFDPATAETVTSAQKGEVVVLAVAFNNKASNASVTKFSFTLKFDSAKLTPYLDTAPFAAPSTYFASNSAKFPGWMIASSNPGSGQIRVSGMSMTPVTAESGKTVLGYVAFRVNDDAADGSALFEFDAASIGASANYSLSDFQSAALTIGNGSSDPTDPTDPADDEPETPEHVTDYAIVFLDDIQKLTPGTAFDPATAEKITSAKKGEVVVLTVAFNNKASDASVTKFSFTLNFDSAKLSPYLDTAPFAAPSTYFASNSTKFPGWMIASSNPESGQIKVSGMSMTPVTAETGTTVLGYVAFQVKDDAEDGQTKFTFDAASIGASTNYDLTSLLSLKLYIGVPPLTVAVTPATDTVTVPDSGSVAKTFTAEVKEGGAAVANPAVTWAWDSEEKFDGVTFSNGTVTVASDAAVTEETTVTVTATYGTTPGTAKLTIQPKGGGTLSASVAPADGVTVDSASGAVRVESGKATTFTATAKNASGAVTWSVTKNGAQDNTFTVNQTTGEITVPADAEGAYLVVATDASGKTAQIALQVGGEMPGEVASLTITLTPAAVAVPADKDAETVAATVVAKDAEDKTVTTPALTWALNEGAPSGVTITPVAPATAATATVSVSKDTKVTGQIPVTVTATAPNGVTGSATLTVSDTPIVLPVLDHVVLTPATVAQGGEAKAEAQTADNTPITTGIRWTADPANTGVSIDASGKITVTATATPGQYVVTAAQGAGESAVSKTATLTVTSSAVGAALDHVTLTPAAVSPDPEAASVTSTAAAFAAGDPPIQITTGVTWSVAPADTTAAPAATGVSINASSGQITVAATAAPGQYVVTAKQGNGENAVFKTATLTVNQPLESGISIIVNNQTPMETAIDIPGIGDPDPAESVPFVAIDTRTGNKLTSGITWSVTENDFGEPGAAVNEQYVAYDIKNGALTVQVKGDAKKWIPAASGLRGKELLVTATRDSDKKSASAIIIVRRSASVFTQVALSLDEEHVSVTGGIPISLTVDGETPQFLQAVAQDQYEEPMAGEFSWKVWTVRADGTRVEQPSNGVTAPANAASSQISVVVVGTAKDGTYSIEATQSETARSYAASMTVSQQNEEAASLTVSEGQNEIEIPGVDEAANLSAAFKALVLNQYGNVMPGAEVTWELFDASGVSKVSSDDANDETAPFRITDGVLKVSHSAKDVVPDTLGQMFTVKATVSGTVGTENEVYGTARIRVKRAAPYLKYITLSRNGDASSPLRIDVDGTQDVSDVTAQAWNQYEDPISAVWSVSAVGSGNGVTANPVAGEATTITVYRTATPGNYNVYATRDGNPATVNVEPKTIVVSHGTPAPSSLVISGGQPSVYIPGDGKAPNTVTYSASVKDQFGADMPGQVIAWNIADSSGAQVPGISIKDGVVEVYNEVKSSIASYKPMTVTASCAGSSGVISAVPVGILVLRAEPILSKVQFDGKDSPDADGKKFTVEYTDGDTVTVAATALDQYGDAFGGVVWDELASYSDKAGVSINSATGQITISTGAASGEFTATARYGNQASVSAPFLIQRRGSNAKTLAAVVLNPATVTVSENSTAISVATALDSDGAPITQGLLWSVQPANSGVMVDSTGNLTISSNASPQNYLIVATPDKTVALVEGNAASTSLLVKTAQEPVSALDHIAVQPTALTVNGTADASAQAAAYDSNGQALNGVTWSISPKNGGVSIDSATGAVNAFKDALSGEYTVTGVKDGVTRTAALTVRNETPTVLAYVRLSPATVTLDGSSPAQSTASAMDSRNGVITEGVAWSLAPADRGVSISDNGVIAITASAVAGDYLITARYSGASESATLRVNSSSTPPDPVVTLDAVTVAPSSVTLDGAAKTATASATGSDGKPMTAGVVWSVSPTDGGVSVNSATGAVSVAADAKPGDYAITAAHGTESKSAVLHVVDSSEPPAPAQYAVTVTPAAITVNGTAAQTARAAATTSDNVAVTGGLIWSVSPAGEGVSVDSLSGVVTVAPTAAGGTYVVTASRGAESHSASLTVTNSLPPALSSVALTPAQVTLDGSGAASSAATALSSNGTALTSGVAWSVTPAENGVSVAGDGVITIAATAVSGSYAVTAIYQGATRSAELTVTGGADVVYQEVPVRKDPAVANTPLDTLAYGASGVKSAADQAAVKNAALSVAKVKEDVSNPATGTETEVVTSVELELKSYSPFIVSVTPTYEVIRKSGGEETTLYKEVLSELSAPITISLNVPADCDAAFAKHTHNGVTYYEPVSYGGTASNRVASWTQQYFSDVELTAESVTVTLNPNGVTTAGVAVSGATVTPTSKAVKAGGKLDSLPAPVLAGFTFVGWYLNDKAVDLNTVFTKAETVVARWQQNSNSNSNTGGGGG